MAPATRGTQPGRSNAAAKAASGLGMTTRGKEHLRAVWREEMCKLKTGRAAIKARRAFAPNAHNAHNAHNAQCLKTDRAA